MSAAPAHDWNERITVECYRPNGLARVVDERGRVVCIVDNYGLLSSDIGPTLLAWLEHRAPDVYGRMTAAGPRALAQAFSHLILPLANGRDMRTQVRWGLADYRHRYGRQAEGMWLPECAVNEDVMAVLAEEGVGFTVLAPGQAAASRPLGEDGRRWAEVDERPVDNRRPYRWLHPDGSGRGVTVLFYDGGLSHDVAFGLGMLSSQGLVDRMVAAGGDEGGVVAIATDGETFGHHHRWGERAVAYALAVEAPRRNVPVTGAGDAIRRHPPTHQVRVRESSWSCAHGVGRWERDCGCSTGGQPGWDQAWREPLRVALNRLRDAAAEVFERRGREVLADPWAARDAYVDVLIGARDKRDFVAQHVTGDRVVALTLLESQRSAMAMYTSCAWFFHDLAGLETVQVLRYAARVIDLLAEVGEGPGEELFLDTLVQARSNVAEEGTGADVWEKHVTPARVTPSRVAAHIVLTSLLTRQRPASRLAAWDVETVDHHRAERGGLALTTGIVRLTHRRTGRVDTVGYGALHLGGFELLGATRPVEDDQVVRDIAVLRSAFAGGESVTELLARVGMVLGQEFGLDAALPDGAEQLLTEAAASLAARFGATLEHLLDDHRGTLEALAAAGYPLPSVVRGPVTLALARRIEAEVARHAGSTSLSDYADAAQLATGPLAAGLDLDTPAARRLLSGLLESAVTRSVAAPPGSDEARAAARLVVDGMALAAELGVHPRLEAAQEGAYQALLRHDRADLSTMGAALGLAVDSLGHPR